ncbi:MAG TPA: nickel pincer cofactor biosynthesis protein LarC [Thermomicrobiales bacterium]|jgi:hypothetical protein|nr:nickel pincer cofactor biosynthesis protein LarC [Thermomicrobiales bacterium]
MRVAWFDPFSGASGDMVLGALIDAGLPIETLREGLTGLDLGGYSLTAERTTDRVIAGTRARVEIDDDRQPTRAWRDIRALIAGSRLPDPVREGALAIFGNLAEVEAAIHGEPIERVHFHEVGGVDAIVDICGACIGLAALGVEAVFSGPPQVGSGMVRSQHGPLPVPAPATTALLARAGAPMAAPRPGMDATPAELLTPTGAAILTTLAEFRRPAMVPVTVGYGYGTKELPWPNALRVIVGDAAGPDAALERVGEPDEVLIETNIDDMNPQFLPVLLERLFDAGALDAWLSPIQAKKGRPGTMVSVIVPISGRAAVEEALFAHTTTLGLRATVIGRRRADRDVITVETPWGPVRLKRRRRGDDVDQVMPEFDDVAAIAREHDLPIRTVWEAARQLGTA